MSKDYFTNRQDRYIVFRNCKPLCDYFDELVETISTFSFQLSANDTVSMRQDFKFHPYLSSKYDFNKEASFLLKAFMKKYVTVSHYSSVTNDNNKSHSPEIFSAESINKLQESTVRNVSSSSSKYVNNKFDSANSSNSSCSSKTLDTLIFPLLQMKTMGIDQDEVVTSNILGTAPKNASLVLATAYFNLTDGYWNALCENDCKNNLLIMAHPKAMGFFNAPGMAGKILNIIYCLQKKMFEKRNTCFT